MSITINLYQKTGKTSTNGVQIMPDSYSVIPSLEKARLYCLQQTEFTKMVENIDDYNEYLEVAENGIVKCYFVQN